MDLTPEQLRIAVPAALNELDFQRQARFLADLLDVSEEAAYAIEEFEYAGVRFKAEHSLTRGWMRTRWRAL